MKKKTLIITGIIAVALCVAGYMATQKDAEKIAIPSKNELLFPGLIAKANDIARIEIEDGKTSMTLVRLEDHWGLSSKHDYPVKFDTVRQTIMDVANMEKLEKKTSNPELYKRIDVEDPSKSADNLSKAIRFYGKDGGTIAALILGKGEYSTESEQYVRKEGDRQSWLVKGRSNATIGDNSWIETDIVDINSARPRSIRIEHADGSELLAERKLPADASFDLVNKPEDRSLKNEYITREFSRMFAGVRLDDVLPRADVKLAENDRIATTSITTFDGLELTLNLYEQGEKNYALFHAAVDKDQIEQENDRRKEEAASTELASPEMTDDTAKAEDADKANAADATKDTEESKKPEPELVDADAIQKEADTINAKTSPWVYIIPKYVADRFSRSMEYFLEEPKTDDAGEGNDGTNTSSFLPQIPGSMMMASTNADEGTSGGLTLRGETAVPALVSGTN